MDAAAIPDRVVVPEMEADLEGKGEHEGGAVKTVAIVVLPIEGGDETIAVEVMLFVEFADNNADTAMGSDGVEGVGSCVADPPVGAAGALCIEDEDGSGAPLIDASCRETLPAASTMVPRAAALMPEF